jgi:hypothetical protein
VTASLSFGGDTITFTSFNPPASGTAFPDDLGTFSPLPGTPGVAPGGVVPGCRHRPFRRSGHGAGAARAEYPEEGVGITTDWWQSTCPASPAALAAKASDNITVNGVVYRILGDARPFEDITGTPFKVTFLSERQNPVA